jgi:hypothetical protein
MSTIHANRLKNRTIHGINNVMDHKDIFEKDIPSSSIFDLPSIPFIKVVKWLFRNTSCTP